MKLRTIEIVGFKSFRDSVRMEISDGMTCIVGPNGCGKSNVVDAIKWAMGDMSPKSLRGDSMQDVIFAGTEARKASGMAEVTLTFENTAATQSREQAELSESEEEAESEEGQALDLGRTIPREFQKAAEIAITRRVHRDGKGEYFINKIPCRLRDIQDLLAGTGLGKQGYSIVEQGQIGFIVNARPEERRLIIEEASGITRYKDQRRRAERKLDQTTQNLQRTSDILDEIVKQLKGLEKQAEKAREHQVLSAELEDLEISLLLTRRHQAAISAAEAEKKLLEAKGKAEEVNDKLEKATQNLQKARVDAHQADKRYADLTENYYKVETRYNLSKSNREHALESMEQARLRMEELEADKRQQEERQVHLKAELVRVREELDAATAQPVEGLDEVEQIAQELAEVKKERAEIVAARDGARRELDQKQANLRLKTDRLGWIQTQIEDLKEREERGQEVTEDAREEARDAQRAINRLTMDYERATEEIERRTKEVGQASTRLEEAKAELARADAREEALTRQRVELKARLDSLEAMRRSGEGYAEGVRRVLEWAQRDGREDILGPAGEYLEVPRGQEAAVAAFLGDRLSDIIVTSRESAFEALAVLEGEEAGRIACYPIPSGMAPGEALQGWLEGLVIVESLAEVPKEAPAGVEAWATRTGDVIFADGRVVGGSVGEQAEAMLRLARELEEIKTEFAQVAEAHKEAAEVLIDAREEALLAEEELTAARDALHEATHRARGYSQERDNEIREKTRQERRLEQLEKEMADLVEQKQKLWAEHRQGTQERDDLAAQIPGLEEEMSDLEKEVTFLDESIEVLSAQLTDQKVRVAQADERRRHLQESVERIEKSIIHAKGQVERFHQEREEQERRFEDGRLRAETLAGEIERQERDHKQIGREVQEAKRILDELAELASNLELAVLGRRQDLDEAMQAVQKFELAKREAELAMEHIMEQLQERFELDLGEAQRRVLAIKLPAGERKGRAEFLKARLRRLGTVNLLAIEEFEETKERHDFHAAQQKDLEESVADLRRAIERMDAESRKRFKETFEAVNAKFQEVFPRLFRGGRARLILTDPKDLLGTGVDIEVQPPGKKLQNVTLLSGGEKALTAVSLIFSIFLLKPTPFAILDEVDAPLDDINVGRFAEMVRDLSKTSQMIVITHNRRTMEAPQRLYGVTMEEAGISKFVSVKLSEADDRVAS